MFADFGVNSDEEVAIIYAISVAREYESEIFEKDCETSITDIAVTLMNATRRVDRNEFHNELILVYDFNKTAIASSRIWNATTSEIEVCQVVRLFIPASGSNKKMVIEEDERVISIAFDLSAGFQLDNNLGPGTIEQGTGSTDVDSYVEACKCDSAQSFTCDTSPLVPNNELVVCIKSVSPDVEINFLDSMVSSTYLWDLVLYFSSN